MSTLDAVTVRDQFDGKTRMICRECLGIIGDADVIEGENPSPNQLHGGRGPKYGYSCADCGAILKRKEY